MRLVVRSLIIICAISLLWLTAAAQDLKRELKVGKGGSVEIVNKYGRVAAKAEPVVGEQPAVSRLTATSPKGVADGEIKMTVVENGSTIITAIPADPRKRIDLIL